MNQRSKVFKTALLAIGCFFLVIFLPASHAEISSEELQKIKNAIPAKATAAPKQPRKLLVFTLAEGYKHNSISYATKALEIMGQRTGAFEVFQSKDMSIFKPERLRQFDAVLFNNTTELRFENPVLRQSLIDFIKNGKGIVGIHAAIDNFYGWPEAAEMMGGLFDGHPWTSDGTWTVKIDDPEHPLVTAFNGKGFKINDEIYRIRAPYPRVKLRVLLSLDLTDKTNLDAEGVKPTDRDVPISWIRSYGNGRLFYCGLGHNPHIFWNPAILRHYLDGIQYALGDLTTDATPSVSEEEIMAKIATYEHGQSLEPLTELADFIRSSYNSPQVRQRIERRMLAFLRSDATLAGKQFICKQLSMIGSEEAVPTLAKMLTETETSDMARYALERIPGATVDSALRKVLHETSGKIKVGIINSLGQRRDLRSVADLGLLIDDSDPTIAGAAAAALGQIADDQAAEILEAAKDKSSGKLRLQVLEAYLRCAERFVSGGQQMQAGAIFKQLYMPGEPTRIRSPALRGMVQADPENAGKIILEVLRNGDPKMLSVAIGLVRGIPTTEEMREMAVELTDLTVASQVQLLTALADRGDPAFYSTVIDATQSDHEEIRIAALKALATLGDHSNVAMLARVAASDRGAESKAARESLYRLRGSKTDNTIVATIPQVSPRVKVELIRCVERRRIYDATMTLLKTAKDADRRVRMASIKALRNIADQRHFQALIGLLIHAQSETERKAVGNTAATVGHRILNKNHPSEVVLAVLPSVQDINVRSSLLQVLGRIGDSKSLPVLRQALNEKVEEVHIAAIRALSGWPGPEPIDDLLAVAQSTYNARHQVLALRGFVRLIGVASNHSPEETISLYQQAMDLAPNVAEKKMVLSALANEVTLSALEMAAGYLEDEALRQEVEVAVVKIAQAIYQEHPRETKKVLQELLKISTNESIRWEANMVIIQII